MRIFFAFLSAVAVQPLVLALRIAPSYFSSPVPMGIGEISFIYFLVVFVSAPVVLVLGIPTFLLLRRSARLGWLSVGLTGFMLGGFLAALFWPHALSSDSASQNWHGKDVEMYIDGSPTIYAWLSYGENIIYYGLHGLVGAVVFYAVWRKLAPVAPTVS
ncbi:hypothetical protein [Pseudoduganella violaceinigra]|uniref:hypothetical protein n=1 Tax=Pseudoduganella violaceinigra TaxID=246602 RepID=UPI0004806F7C|nr:hypothetical protein [Pseudoduganella violaceinigra]